MSSPIPSSNYAKVLKLLFSKKSKFSSTQIPLEGKLKEKLLELANSVGEEDLGEDGRELDPHITILYGLHDEDPEPVKKLLARVRRPIKFKLGKVSLFSGEETGKDYDVLKVEVDSKDLHTLNKLLATLPHSDTYPTYKPHATISYVKKGLGQEYLEKFGDLDLDGESDTVTFSNKDREHTDIRVGRKC